jgi:hypothetical protein
MKLKFTVTDLEGNEREVVAGFSEQVRYEEYTGRPVTGWGKDNPPGIRDWAVLCWLTETNESMPFRAWTDSVEMVMLAGTVEANPTSREVSATSP